MREVLRSKNFESISNIRHGFFTRSWGDCGFANSEEGFNNHNPRRDEIAQSLKAVPASLLSCYQTHSSDVEVVTKPWLISDRPKADAMVTNVPGLALGILTADCVPVLFVDRGQGIVGASHAGWRGALGGILENTLTAMEKCGANRRFIHAALGPCIWQESYEVSKDFTLPFFKDDPANSRFFIPSTRDGHFMFDLPGYVEMKLRRFGIASVQASPADTARDEGRFFSYRRSTLRQKPREGSLISVIVLAD